MLGLKCAKHPRYTGELPPRASCEFCYWLWRIRQTAELNRVTIITKAKVMKEE